MKVEIEDVLYWMDAIRNSKDRYRTLESFWKGQVRSKIWLIDKLLEQEAYSVENHIVIHGGWNGVLASLMFNSKLTIDSITSCDIDPQCEIIADTINKRYRREGRFSAITVDMTEYKYYANTVINTSCEHLTQKQYDKWLRNVPEGAVVALQSNDYFECKEHVRCAQSLSDFEEMSKINTIFKGTLDTDNYRRFMIIGYK